MIDCNVMGCGHSHDKERNSGVIPPVSEPSPNPPTAAIESFFDEVGDCISTSSPENFGRVKEAAAKLVALGKQEGMDEGAASACERIRDRFHADEYIKRNTLIDFLAAARTAHRRDGGKGDK